MKEILCLSIIASVVIFPTSLRALEVVQLDGLGGSLGVPSFWEIHVFRIHFFPFHEKTMLSRLGCECIMGRFGVSNTTRHAFTEMFPFKIDFLLYPASIKDVGIKTPIYTYIYLGGGIWAHGFGSSPWPEVWGGGGMKYWNAGLGLSFKGIVELDLGYVGGTIDEYLCVDSKARMISYSSGFKFNRVFAVIRLELGTNLLSWE